jgi:hypothetical protein
MTTPPPCCTLSCFPFTHSNRFFLERFALEEGFAAFRVDSSFSLGLYRHGIGFLLSSPTVMLIVVVGCSIEHFCTHARMYACV